MLYTTLFTCQKKLFFITILKCHENILYDTLIVKKDIFMTTRYLWKNLIVRKKWCWRRCISVTKILCMTFFKCQRKLCHYTSIKKYLIMTFFIDDIFYWWHLINVKNLLSFKYFLLSTSYCNTTFVPHSNCHVTNIYMYMRITHSKLKIPNTVIFDF